MPELVEGAAMAVVLEGGMADVWDGPEVWRTKKPGARGYKRVAPKSSLPKESHHIRR